MTSTRRPDPEDADLRILLATTRDWFASALRAVLEPDGFRISQVRTAAAAIREVQTDEPAIIIVDEGLPDASASQLCTTMIAAPVHARSPILVYSPSFWHEREQAEAVAAGAWDIISEPIRSHFLVAKLRRLVEIRQLLREAERARTEHASGLYSLDGLMRALPVIGSVADRSNAPLSCAVIGPTKIADSRDDRRRQRQRTAELCSRHTRASDICGWIGGFEIAVVAYDADVEAAAKIVRRLGREAAGLRPPNNLTPLSAGIIDLSAAEILRSSDTPVDPSTPPMPERMASLSRFASAQSALTNARRHGGGIRLAEPV